jgi:hypothetical protein
LHNLEQNNNVYVGFLDISSAFDTVWGMDFFYLNFSILESLAKRGHWYKTLIPTRSVQYLSIK